MPRAAVILPPRADVVGPSRGQHEQVAVSMLWLHRLQPAADQVIVLRVLSHQREGTRQHGWMLFFQHLCIFL